MKKMVFVLLVCLLLVACADMSASPSAQTTATSVQTEPTMMQPGGYNESPDLHALVAKGEMPPVTERLPEHPLSVDVVQEIGTYGGVWRVGFMGPADDNSYITTVYDALVRFTPQGDRVLPYLAESVDPSQDFKVWTITLRKGGKWSDGKPFTADDIVFWYNDVLLNADLTSAKPSWILNRDGTPADVEKVDEYTVRVVYQQPVATFLMALAGQDGAARSYPPFLPAHYLKQFHAKYVAAADLQQLIAVSGFTTWAELFAAKALPFLNPDRPVMAAWMPVTTLTDKVFTLKRNPYFIGVDTSGNQLPYIDEIRFTFYSNQESLNLAAMAGELDLQIRNIDFAKFPLLIENQQSGDYRVLRWNSFGTTLGLSFNMTYQEKPEITALYSKLDFRKALSLGLNRSRMKELLFLGMGEARQPVPPPEHVFYPGDEYAHKYTQFDSAEANRLLDSLGLAQRNSDGFRLLPNGDVLTIELSTSGQNKTYVDACQLVAEDWKALGVKTDLQIHDRALHFQRVNGNQVQVLLWENDTTGFPFVGGAQSDPTKSSFLGPLWKSWFQTQGASGVKPPDDIRSLADLQEQARMVGPEEQVKIAQEIYRRWVDNVWQIGLVGMMPVPVVVKHTLSNVPETMGHNWALRTPGGARPEQFFFKRGV